MTEQEQNVAVAELQGWHHRQATRDNPVERDGMRLPNYFGPPIEAFWNDRIEGVYGSPPNYTRDLTAIHAAVLTLSRENLHQDPFIWSERDQYLCELESIIFRDVEKAEGKPRQEIQFELVNATAAQCTEAYLRTKGRWKE